MKDQNKKKAVLVTGGFHTEGLSELFRERGISYVVVSPKITNEFSREKYLKLITQTESPLKEIGINTKALELALKAAGFYLDVDYANVRGEVLESALLHTLPSIGASSDFQKNPEVVLAGVNASVDRLEDSGVFSDAVTVNSISENTDSTFTANVSITTTTGTSTVTTTSTAGDVNHVVIKVQSVDVKPQAPKKKTKPTAPQTLKTGKSLGTINLTDSDRERAWTSMDTIDKLLPDTVEDARINHALRAIKAILADLGVPIAEKIIDREFLIEKIAELQKLITVEGSVIKNTLLGNLIQTPLIDLTDWAEKKLEEPWIKQMNDALAVRGLKMERVYPFHFDLKMKLEASLEDDAKGGEEFVLSLGVGKLETPIPFAYAKLDRDRYQIRLAPHSEIFKEMKSDEKRRDEYRKAVLTFAHVYVSQTGYLLTIKDVRGGWHFRGFLEGELTKYHPVENVPNKKEQDFSLTEPDGRPSILTGKRYISGSDLLDPSQRVLSVEYGFNGSPERVVITPFAIPEEKQLGGWVFYVIPQKAVLTLGPGMIAGEIAVQLQKIGVDVGASNRSPNDKARNMRDHGIPLYELKVPGNEANNAAQFLTQGMPTKGDVISQLLAKKSNGSPKVDLIVEGIDGKVKPMMEGEEGKLVEDKKRGKEISATIDVLERIFWQIRRLGQEGYQFPPVIVQGSIKPKTVWARTIETQLMEALGMSFDDIPEQSLTLEDLTREFEKDPKGRMRPEVRAAIQDVLFTPSCNTHQLLDSLGVFALPEFLEGVKRVSVAVSLTRRGTELGSPKRGDSPFGFGLDPEHHGGKDMWGFFEQLPETQRPKMLSQSGKLNIRVSSKDGHLTRYHTAEVFIEVLMEDGTYMDEKPLKKILARMGRVALVGSRDGKFDTSQVNQVIEGSHNTRKYFVNIVYVVPKGDRDGFLIYALTPQETNVIGDGVTTALMKLGLFKSGDLGYANAFVNRVTDIERNRRRLEDALPDSAVQYVPPKKRWVFPNRGESGAGQIGEGASLGFSYNQLVQFIDSLEEQGQLDLEVGSNGIRLAEKTTLAASIDRVTQILSQIPRNAGIESDLSIEGVLKAARFAAYRTVRPELPEDVSDYLYNQIFSSQDKKEQAIQALRDEVIARRNTIFAALYGNEKPSLGITVTTSSINSPEATVARLLANEGGIALVALDSPNASPRAYDRLIKRLKLSDEKKKELSNRLIFVRPSSYEANDIKALLTTIMSGRQFDSVIGEKGLTLAKLKDRVSVGEIERIGSYLAKHTVALADQAFLPDADRVPGVQLISVNRSDLDDAKWSQYRILATSVASKLAHAGKFDALPYEVQISLDRKGSDIFGFKNNYAELLDALGAGMEGYLARAQSA